MTLRTKKRVKKGNASNQFQVKRIVCCVDFEPEQAMQIK